MDFHRHSSGVTIEDEEGCGKVYGYIGLANLITTIDRLEVNWSACGSVSVADAEQFALRILHVCAAAKAEYQAMLAARGK